MHSELSRTLWCLLLSKIGSSSLSEPVTKSCQHRYLPNIGPPQQHRSLVLLEARVAGKYTATDTSKLRFGLFYRYPDASKLGTSILVDAVDTCWRSRCPFVFLSGTTSRHPASGSTTSSTNPTSRRPGCFRSSRCRPYAWRAVGSRRAVDPFPPRPSSRRQKVAGAVAPRRGPARRACARSPRCWRQEQCRSGRCHCACDAPFDLPRFLA
jgi:hypothetical protein